MKVPSFIESTKTGKIGILIFLITLHFVLSSSLNYLFRINAFSVITGVSRQIIQPTLIANLILVVIYGSILFLIAGLKPRDIGFVKNKLGKGILFGLIVWILANLLGVLFRYINSGQLSFSETLIINPSRSIGILIGQLFGNAFIEESLFRGYLTIQLFLIFKSHFGTERKTILPAIIVGQIFFSLQHLPSGIIYQQISISEICYGLLWTFATGIVLAIIYLRTENLFFTIIIHALTNCPFEIIETKSPVSLLILLGGLSFAIFGRKMILQNEIKTVGNSGFKEMAADEQV